MLPDFRRKMDSAPTPMVAQNALGLQIGVHVQAYDAALQSLAGLSVVQGNILYGSAADTLALLAKDTNATRYLANTGASNNPAWAQVNLANGVTGTLPVVNGGTGVAAIPSFSVHRNGSVQSINDITETKIQFTTERWDTGGYFDSATNYRYTPLVAGTYLFKLAATVAAVDDGTTTYVVLYKNGSLYEYGGTDTVGFAGVDATPTGTWLVQMNGSTDYVEFYVWHNHGSARDLAGASTDSHASGCWIGP
jgi:hypothetical protein